MRPNRDTLLLETAAIWAKRGTCSRARVGCVISRDGRILVQGYNGAPRGLPHCEHVGDEPCTIATHAEANAIAYAARVGVILSGAEMHSTRVPCTNCAMLIINAGIERVIYLEEHRDMGGLALLRQALIAVDRASYDDWEAFIKAKHSNSDQGSQ